MTVHQKVQQAERLLESVLTDLDVASPASDAQTAAPAILGCGADHPEIVNPRDAQYIFQRGLNKTGYGTMSRIGGGYVTNAHVTDGFDYGPLEALYGRCRVLPDHDTHVFGDATIPDASFAEGQHVYSIGFPGGSRFAERRSGVIIFTRDDRSPIPQAIFRLNDGERHIVGGESGSIVYGIDDRPLGLLRATGITDDDGDGLPDGFGYAVPFARIRAAL